MKAKLIRTGSIQSKRNSACTLIDNKILIDVPNGITKRLMNMDEDVHGLEVCIITHFHGDHCFDLPFLLLTLAGNETREKPFYIIGPKGIEEKTKQLMEIAFPGDWEFVEKYVKSIFIEVENQTNITIEDFTILPIQVEHGNCENAYGYVIERDNKKIGLTGDSCLCDGIETIGKQCDVMIADMSLEKGSNTHMGIDDMIYLSQKYSKTIYPTHMRETTREKAKETIETELIVIAEDGDIFEV